MSLKSWKKEFYSTEAENSRPGKSAVTHSLRKWRGLTKANLKKHGLDYKPYEILEKDLDFDSNYYQDGSMDIDATTCALCVHYLDEDYESENNCAKCPLFKVLGYPCDRHYTEEKGPFQVWVDTGNPRPMIKALEKAEASFPVRKR